MTCSRGNKNKTLNPSLEGTQFIPLKQNIKNVHDYTHAQQTQTCTVLSIHNKTNLICLVFEVSSKLRTACFGLSILAVRFNCLIKMENNDGWLRACSCHCLPLVACSNFLFCITERETTETTENDTVKKAKGIKELIFQPHPPPPPHSTHTQEGGGGREATKQDIL